MAVVIVIVIVLVIIIWCGNRLKDCSWVCYLVLESFEWLFSQYYLISPSEMQVVQDVIHRPNKSRIYI